MRDGSAVARRICAFAFTQSWSRFYPGVGLNVDEVSNAPALARPAPKKRPFPKCLALTPLPSLATGASGGAAVAQAVQLAFTMQVQEQSNWCWAAVATSVGLFFRTGLWTQCGVASSSIPAFPGSDSSAPTPQCCSDGTGNCNTYGYLDVALETTESFASFAAGALDFESLTTDLNDQRPVCVRIAWNPISLGAAHFVAIVGCSTDPSTDTRYVDVADPATGSIATCPFGDQSDPTAFPNQYDGIGGQWSYTYLTANSLA